MVAEEMKGGNMHSVLCANPGTSLESCGTIKDYCLMSFPTSFLPKLMSELFLP